MGSRSERWRSIVVAWIHISRKRTMIKKTARVANVSMNKLITEWAIGNTSWAPHLNLSNNSKDNKDSVLISTSIGHKEAKSSSYASTISRTYQTIITRSKAPCDTIETKTSRRRQLGLNRKISIAMVSPPHKYAKNKFVNLPIRLEKEKMVETLTLTLSMLLSLLQITVAGPKLTATSRS